MAPNRGSHSGTEDDDDDNLRYETQGSGDPLVRKSTREQARASLAARAAHPSNFTARGIIVGLAIGTIIVFSNTYFGLQTGWISGMSMPSVLISFALFRAAEKVRLPFLSNPDMPFSPVENVLVQAVSGSVGTMPLGCGFVGIVPALEFLLKPSENGPLNLNLGKLSLWAIGICLFGVVFAVPLRKQVIIREKLRFPTGTATALLIGVLHGQKGGASIVQQEGSGHRNPAGEEDENEALMAEEQANETQDDAQEELLESQKYDEYMSGEWKTRIRTMALAFAGTAVYTVFSYFVPQVRRLPIFGKTLANVWLWTFNPSPAYIGQGIIMGPATTTHMLIGAILGWGILSPLAKSHGWAAGPVGDWETGSKGWIVWISLAIMLADAIVSLGLLIIRPMFSHGTSAGKSLAHTIRRGDWRSILKEFDPFSSASTTAHRQPYQASSSTPLLGADQQKSKSQEDEEEVDAPPEHLTSGKAFLFWLAVSLILYFVAIHFAFPGLVPFGATIMALLVASILSVMGVRALGETDLNPVSGISKLAQLVFAAIIPVSNPNAIPINLIAGAIGESGALQAGDLLQDLKTGHLLGASPNAQFNGQLIGSVFGAFVSALAYKLYTNVYTIPSEQFQTPTAYVWIFTARLVTGKGLPPKVTEFAIGFAALFAAITVVRVFARGKSWVAFVPGGIAVAVGMYNEPNFTLARAIGGLVNWYWTRWRGNDETGVIVLASGFILGEGLVSILNLGLAKAGVPHL